MTTSRERAAELHTWWFGANVSRAFITQTATYPSGWPRDDRDVARLSTTMFNGNVDEKWYYVAWAIQGVGLARAEAMVGEAREAASRLGRSICAVFMGLAKTVAVSDGETLYTFILRNSGEADAMAVINRNKQKRRNSRRSLSHARNGEAVETPGVSSV